MAVSAENVLYPLLLAHNCCEREIGYCRYNWQYYHPCAVFFSHVCGDLQTMLSVGPLHLSSYKSNSRYSRKSSVSNIKSGSIGQAAAASHGGLH